MRSLAPFGGDALGAGEVLLGVDLAPGAVDEYRRQTQASAGHRVEGVAEVGLAQGGRASEGTLEPAASQRVRPYLAQSRRPCRREVRQPDELAGRLFARQRLLANPVH